MRRFATKNYSSANEFLCTAKTDLDGRTPQLVCTQMPRTVEGRRQACPKKTKYVQAGAPDEGNGTKTRPYNSLANAQADSTWRVLVVLSSTIALDGGILLKDGQKIKGDRSPFSGIQLPIVTNSTNTLNDGNGIIIAPGATVTIKNLWITDTFASAIRYDGARNVYVRNVLITGTNQGEIIESYPYNVIPGTRSKFFTASIQGAVSLDGEVELCNVSIRGFHIGLAGFVEFALSPAKRKVLIMGSEFTELGNNPTTNPIPPGVVDRRVQGVNVQSDGGLAREQVMIRETTFHDYLSGSIASSNFGILMDSRDGAQTTALIEECDFSFLSQSLLTFMIAFGSVTDPAAVPNFPSGRSVITVTAKNNNFVDDPAFSTVGIDKEPLNGVAKLIATKNTLQDLMDTFQSILSGVSDTISVIEENNASGTEAFFLTISELDTAYNSPNTIIENDDINRNTYVGGKGLGGIIILPDAFGEGPAPWNSLVINATENCFDGQSGNGFAALAGIDFSADSEGAGNATINAHFNNFDGYRFDIYDDISTATGTNFIADNNYWGTPAGPQNIDSTGAGTVLTDPFLTNPITCFVPSGSD
jgi:hypothetical protein